MVAQGEEMIRKGPWTEQEDLQLVLCVNVYGDRRWDFIAKVSGLKRTGKSCRLRWVNYLNPGLKRGKMTPHEERLVLQLHSKWGNRWSRIARKLPGRTDNEIKNYWRTHTRKKAQERKKGTGAAVSLSPSSSSTSSTTTTTSSSSAATSSTSSSAFSNCSSSSVSDRGNRGGRPPTAESAPAAEKKDRSFFDTGGFEAASAAGQAAEEKSAQPQKVDEIWKDMDFFGDDPIKPVYNDYGYGGCNFPCQSVASPVWDYLPVSLWAMDDEEDESKKFPPTTATTDQFYSFYNNQETMTMSNTFLTG